MSETQINTWDIPRLLEYLEARVETCDKEALELKKIGLPAGFWIWRADEIKDIIAMLRKGHI